MNFDLDKINYDIFLSLLQDPLQSERSIAKFTGINLPIVRDRLYELRKSNFVRSDKKISDPVLGERFQTEVEAEYIPKAIGLEKIHVLFTEIQDTSKILGIRQSLDSYPYCHYQTQCSANTGINFSLFHIPVGTAPLLEQFCKTTASLYNCKLIFLDNYTFEAKSEMDFSQWDFIKQLWSLSQQKLDVVSHLSGSFSPENILEQSILNFLNDKSKSDFLIRKENDNSIDLKDTIFDSYSNLDMTLIRELTINAKISTKELSEIYDVDRSTIYRHVNNLNKNVINDYVLYYNHSFFDITINILIFGTFKNNSDLNFHSFSGYLQSGLFPYQSTLVSNGKDFLWQVATTPYFLTEISDFSWRYFDQHQFLHINTRTSFKYFFSSNNFLPERKWRQDKEFMFGEID